MGEYFYFIKPLPHNFLLPFLPSPHPTCPLPHSPRNPYALFFNTVITYTYKTNQHNLLSAFSVVCMYNASRTRHLVGDNQSRSSALRQTNLPSQ